jgi:cytochrome b6-f complex iron-sulfur subunit
MAEKKKMSVAEILAAARKQNSDAGAPPSAEAPKPEQPPAEPAAPAPAAPAAKAPASEAPASEAPAAKPKAASGGRPSVAEMMAMARAGGKAKPDEAAPATAATATEEKLVEKPAAKPAARPAAKKEAAETGAVGPKDTASILAAARKSAKPGPVSKETAAAMAAPAVVSEPAPAKREKVTAAPPMPAKPAYVKKPAAAAADEDRRGFLSAMLGTAMGLGFTALAGTGGLWTLGFARFMFPNILTEPPSKFKVGFPDAFPPGYVETKFIPQFGVWVVKGEYNGQSQIYALRSVCTHLGCTPNWLEAEQKFKCPCHGSGFYKDGINFEGPAPRPLERYAIRLADDGQLEIDKSRIFQEEMGGWVDPASFVPV